MELIGPFTLLEWSVLASAVFGLIAVLWPEDQGVKSCE